MGEVHWPVIVYGVWVNDEQLLDRDILEKYELELYASSMRKGYGCDPVYGVECDFDEVNNGCENAELVRKFLADAKRRGFDFGEPRFALALGGYFEYWPYDPMEWHEMEGDEVQTEELEYIESEESDNEKDE